MKPKFRRFAKTALPALIVVPAFLGSAHATVIMPATTGNVLVTTSTIGTAHTVLASGSTLATSPYVVVINSGVTLTGDAVEKNGIEVTAAGYTIQNSGILNVTGRGVLSNQGNLVINNSGTIQGTNDGIHFDVNGGTVTNGGTIAGITGQYSDGIKGQDGLTVTNNSVISGAQQGVDAGDNLILDNNHGASITGGTRAGVEANDIARIDNAGSISGHVGIVVDDNATIRNEAYDISSNPIAGASITGNNGDGIATGDVATIYNQRFSTIMAKSDGIYAGSNLNLTNYGSITAANEGEGRDGVYALETATITNHASGTISGDTHGIHIERSKILDIASMAIASLETELIPTTTITNDGTITGGSVGIYADSLSQPLLINNSGTIETRHGDYAIELHHGDNVINLDYGSTVDGSIEGGGSAILNFRDGQDNPLQDSNIVYGDVSGINAINKDGSGFAFIGETGDSYEVEANSINVNSGGLFINGDVYGSDGDTQITVDGAGAELGGSSDKGWDADISLLNGGGISAGSTPIDLAGNSRNTVGALTINGNVTHALNSESYVRVNINPQADTTLIGIANGVSHDTIYNNGSYDIGNADIRITPTNHVEVLSNGRYTIIDSNHPIIGAEGWDGALGVQFSESGGVSYNSVLTNYFTTVETENPPLVPVFASTEGDQMTPLLGDTDVVLRIQHDYEGLPGLTPNQSSLGSAIDASVSSPNVHVQEFIASLDYSDLETVQATLATLDPGVTFGVVGSVVNSNYRLHRLTQQHLAGVRNSETVTEAGPSTTDAKGATVAGPATTHSAGRGNAWGSLSYDWQDNNVNDYPDYDGETGAITAGFDWRITNELVLGLVLDGSSGDFNSDGFDSDVDSLRAAVYGTWGTSTGFYSDFLLGYGDHDIDSNRSLAGQLSGHAKSDTNADSFQALWTVGYTMGDAVLKHGPFAGFEYQNVNVDGFSESGLPFTMKVDGYDVDSFRGLIGYRVDANYGTFRPYGSVAYAHEFEDGANSTTASFAGNDFRISGAEQSSAFLITLGTGVSLSSSLTLDVGYRGEIATDDGMTSHGGSLGLNYSF